MPDEATIPQFRRLLKEYKLSSQILALANELLGIRGLLLRASAVDDAALTEYHGSWRFNEKSNCNRTT